MNQAKRESLNKLNDAMFKTLFRSIKARGIVSGFLSAVTHIPKEVFLNADFIGGEI